MFENAKILNMFLKCGKKQDAKLQNQSFLMANDLTF